MKVILTQAVEPLGKEGDLVNVADGYGQNYLITRGLAVPATPGNIKQWEQKRQSLARREAQRRAEAEEQAKKLEGKAVEIGVKAGEKGRLYGSVTTKDVSEAIKKQLKFDVDKKKIEMPESIKELGSYTVIVKVYPEVESAITVNVIESKEEE